MTTRGINIPLDIGASVAGMVGKTGNNTEQEDSPSAPSPARITNIMNVLPTELGYRSAFGLAPIANWAEQYYWGESFRFVRVGETQGEASLPELGRVINKLKEARAQEVMAIETPERRRVFIILAELGIYIMNGGQVRRSHSEGGDPLELVELVEAFYPDDYFRLWTTAVLDGTLYCYRQGDPEVYLIGDAGVAHQLDNQEGLVYRKVFSREGTLLEVLAAKPTFLNMEGQVGIFRANNRLGFWDSDNSIAWGSAFSKLDFTPDVVSMAGITKFTNVSGQIVKILSTVSGFIIYSTSSIVRVSQMLGSEERWTGSSILDNVGITYSIHVTSAADSDTHYAWTTDGIYRINNEGAEQILVEEFNEWSKSSHVGLPKLYRLLAVGDSYLTFSEATSWEVRPVDTQLRVGLLKGDDRVYPFYLPKIQPYVPERFWQDFLNGTYDLFPDTLDMDDWELLEDGHPPMEELKPLAPCFSGWRYRTPAWLINIQATVEPGITGSLQFSDSLPLIVEDGDDPVYATIIIDDLKNYTASLRGYTEVSTQPLDWQARQASSSGEPRQAYDVAGNELIELLEEVEQQFEIDRAPIWERVRGTYRARSVLMDNGIYRPVAGTFGYHIMFIHSTKQLLEGFDAEAHDKRPIYSTGPWDGKLTTHFDHLDDIAMDVVGIPAVTARAAVPAEVLSQHVIPQAQPLIFGNQMTEDSYEYYKSAILGTGYNTNYLRQREKSAGKNLPVPDVPVVKVYDDCSLRMYAFIDEVILVEEFGATLHFFEEIELPPYKIITANDVLVGTPTEIKDSSGITIRWEYPISMPHADQGAWTELPPISKGIIKRIWRDDAFAVWGNTTFSTRSYVDPASGLIQRAVLGQRYSDNPYGFEVLGHPADYISKGGDQQANAVLVSSAVKAVPKSFMGKTLEEINHMLDPDNIKEYPEVWKPILELELSGYGHFGTTSTTMDFFTKTISRARLDIFNPEGQCEPRQETRQITQPYEQFIPFMPDEKLFGSSPGPGVPPIIPPYKVSPDDDNYPALGGVSFPTDISYAAIFRQGTVAPYYPVYEKAWVYDLNSEKWGSLDRSHGLLFPIAPINALGSKIQLEGGLGLRDRNARILPFGILPRTYGVPGSEEYMWRVLWFYLERTYLPWEPASSYRYWKAPANAFGRHMGVPTLLTDTSNIGRLSVNTIAMTRDGYTKLVGLSGRSIGEANVYVESSNQGETFGERMWETAYYDGSYHRARAGNFYLPGTTSGDFRFPFVLVGKEFRLTFEGEFSLDKLLCYGKPVGGIRFFDPFPEEEG